MTGIQVKLFTNMRSALKDVSNLDHLTMDSTLLRVSDDVVTPHVCTAINLPLPEGICYGDLKLTRVTPLYKSKFVTGFGETVDLYHEYIAHSVKTFE